MEKVNDQSPLGKEGGRYLRETTYEQENSIERDKSGGFEIKNGNSNAWRARRNTKKFSVE